MDEQPLRFSLVDVIALPLGLPQAMVLTNKAMPLDSATQRPQQSTRRGRGDTKVRIGASFEGQRGQLLFAAFAKDQHGLFGAAGAQCRDEVQGVERGRLVRDEHGVVHFATQAGGRVAGSVSNVKLHMRRAVGRQRLGQPESIALPAPNVQQSQFARQHAQRSSRQLVDVQSSGRDW